MFFYNIMASHKTNKRSYKKRTPKRKTQKGGDIKMFGYTCTKNKVEPEDNMEVEDEDEEEDVVKEEEEEEEEDVVKEEEEDVVEEEEEDEDVVKEEEEDVVEEEEEGEQGGMGKKGRKSRKSTKKVQKPHKKNRKTMKKKGKSAWTTFVVELYRKNKQKNPVYMFKNALKDAAKIYKK